VYGDCTMNDKSARVFPFCYGSDDSLRMRVVITGANEVCVEQLDGRDALGVERWVDANFDEVNQRQGHR
jgi:hypothetical protein